LCPRLLFLARLDGVDEELVAPCLVPIRDHVRKVVTVASKGVGMGVALELLPLGKGKMPEKKDRDWDFDLYPAILTESPRS
jgi:hypothetical protein